MKYALVNEERQEASQGAKGQCLCCGADVIAKCGKIRRWHWAHKNNEECPYSQKELKTQWHLDWQNLFPKDWQEVRCTDEQTGKIHIADIKTPKGLVIEFQHSHIKPEDRLSREQFHKNMIWVVDGTRLQNNFKRFSKNFENLRPIPHNISEIPFSLYTVDWIKEILPASWLPVSVPVYFDFRLERNDDMENSQQKSLRNLIWGFFQIETMVFAVSMQHNCFVDYVQRETISIIELFAIAILQKKPKLYPVTVQRPSRTHKQIYCREYIDPGMNPKKINHMKSKNPGFRF